jgi:hypothetical protein
MNSTNLSKQIHQSKTLFMNRFTLLIFSSCFAISSTAQNVGIGIKNPLSKLHVAGDVRIDSLAQHDSGVVSYNQSGVLQTIKFTGRKSDILRGDGSFHSLDAITEASANWLTTGNSGIDTAIHFLGTTDNSSLRFRVNNIRSGEINPINGNVTLGIRSLNSNITGSGNIVIGRAALQHIINAKNTIAIGDSSLYTHDRESPIRK